MSVVESEMEHVTAGDADSDKCSIAGKVVVQYVHHLVCGISFLTHFDSHVLISIFQIDHFFLIISAH